MWHIIPPRYMPKGDDHFIVSSASVPTASKLALAPDPRTRAHTVEKFDGRESQMLAPACDDRAALQPGVLRPGRRRLHDRHPGVRERRRDVHRVPEPPRLCPPPVPCS